jgi:hypothetical protein
LTKKVQKKSGKEQVKENSELIAKLKRRFEENLNRHKNLKWAEIEARLVNNQERLWSLSQMEQSGGEPDVVAFDSATDQFLFFDCSSESPIGRRSVCYDHEALKARKEHKPAHSAIAMAEEMKIELLTEDQYRYLQTLGPFDTKTSSWLYTPLGIRKLKGAIFGDCRYGEVFKYHNSAESYYASRGFRCVLKV